MLFLGAVALWAAYVLMSTIFHNSRICFIILIGCPFMAYAAKNSFTVVVWLILLLTVWCIVSIASSRSKHQDFMKSLFLKGERKHDRVFIREYDDGEGNVTPEHYETEYYFELAPNQPKALSSIISWGLFIIPFGILGLVYFILKTRLQNST
jgi:Ca2+/Na+ antiporter